MKISIVVPNYNYAEFIGRTLDSILNQSYNPKEIIFVDDGSTDESLSIIQKYEQVNPHIIKVIRQENRGQASAINKGFEQISGEIIGWINSDDTYCHSAFTKVMSVFLENNNVDVVFGNINVVDLNGYHIYTLKHFKFSYFLSVFTGFANNMSNNAVFWRRRSYSKAMLLNTSYKCGLDNELFSRLTHKKKTFHINEPLANFRKQEVSKAAIGNKNWEILMNNESDKVFEQSYAKLSISRFVPTGLAKKLKIIFVTYKRLLKIATGKYFSSLLEKKRYKTNRV